MINNHKNGCTRSTWGGDNVDAAQRTMTKFSNFCCEGAAMHVAGQPFPIKCNFQQERTVYGHSWSPGNHAASKTLQSEWIQECAQVSHCLRVCVCVYLQACECVCLCAWSPACLLYYFPSGSVLSGGVV